MSTPLTEIEAAAAVAYCTMNADERAGCRFGMFPHEIMQAAAEHGFDIKAFSVALIKLAETGKVGSH